MQTIERPSAPPRRRPPWGAIGATIGALAVLPLLLLAVLSRWGVLIAVAVAAIAGLAIWVKYRGFVFIEIVAFLIHFDGIGAGPIRMGRVIAVVATLYIGYKLISGWRPPAIPMRHWGPVWVLTAWAVLSGMWSPNAGGWLYSAGVFGLGLVFFAITALLLENHRMVQQFLRAYWIGGLAGAGAGVLALFLGTRSVGFGQDPNFFGLLQASMIPLTVYYRRHAPTVFMKHLYTVTLLLVIAGAAGAGSRSGLIGSSLAIVATMMTRPGLSTGRRVGSGLIAVALAAVAALLSVVLNPNIGQRGLSDRGAGRVDLWTVAGDLIQQNPVRGYGFGQLQSIVPPNLLLTPGSQMLTERRTDVSAHNTWIDIMGDLGVLGVGLFAVVFLVALYGFARPRWLETRELSTTMFVMMLPVLTGSLFLPLLNNKLAWALIGISAALQVPSDDARWRSMSGRVPPPPSRSTELVAANGALVAPGGAVVPTSTHGARPPVAGDEVLPEVELARWDLAFGRRAVVAVALTALLGGIGAGVIGNSGAQTHTATAGLLLSTVDGDAQGEFVRTDITRLQVALTMTVSGAYAAELKELSGIDLSVEEIRENMFPRRPRMGFYVEVDYTDTDRERVLAVQPHLVEALDNVYRSAQELAFDEAVDQRRQIVPGESLVYQGPAYLRAFEDATIAESSPRTTWYVFIGLVLGGLVGTGVVLTGQRRPRVRAEDDLWARVGMPVWARVGGRSRRNRANRFQYSQALASARATSPPQTEPHRFVVTAPVVHRHVEELGLGLAAELVGEGRRVVLVDARRPGARLRRGLLGHRSRGLSAALSGRASLVDVMAPVRRAAMPRLMRTMAGGHLDQLRVVAAGRPLRPGAQEMSLSELLDQLDPSVSVVVLAPPLVEGGSVSDVLAWGDAVLLGVVRGRTVTYDLEDAAGRVRTFATGADGIVMLSP